MQSPSWEANWSAASQEIPRISRNPKVRYHPHKRPPPLSILGQPNSVHIPTSHLLEKYPNIIHPSTPRSPQWSLSLRCPHQDPIHPPLLTHMRHMPRRIVLSPEQAFHMCVFLNRSVLQEGVVSISPNPQAGGPSLVGCPWLLIQFIRSYPPYRRPFLYLQPEDASCRGDRDPLTQHVQGICLLSGLKICKPVLYSWQECTWLRSQEFDNLMMTMVCNWTNQLFKFAFRE